MQGDASPWDRPGPWSAPPAERRSLAGLLGAVVLSLALWGFLLLGVLGLILKITS